MDYPIVIVPLSEDDGGGWLGFVPDLPGCMSDGETQAEAAANATDAISEWLNECERVGRKAPEPGSMAAKVKAELKKLVDKVHSLSSENKNLDAQLKKLAKKFEELEALSGWTGAYPGVQLKSTRGPEPVHV